MLIHQENTFSDYLAALRRRLWLIAVPVLVGPLAAYFIAHALPPSYLSQSLILVEQPKVPDNYVKPVVTGDLTQRLAAMQEQILSRTHMQPLIERYGLYRSEARGGAAIEDLVDELRRAVSVTPVQFPIQPPTESVFSRIFHLGGTTTATTSTTSMASGKRGTEQAPGFTISFTAESPRLAQQVCSELTSMFTQEDIRMREQNAQGTEDFVSTELEDAKRKLDEQNAKLAAFKRRYIGALPDEQQTNLQMLTTLNTQLGTGAELLNRARQDKAFDESMLAQELAAWQDSQSGKNPLTLQEQLTKARDALTQLEARYTSSHPDVIKAKDTVAQLEKKQALETAEKEKNPKVPAKAMEPTQIQQLRAQLHQAEETIRLRSQEQEHIEQQIKLYESRIQMTPQVEEQFKDLTRDYQTALKSYNDLLANRNQSQMASDLERRQLGEVFRVLDPASLPDRPSFPDPVLFVVGGIGVGAALGFGLALLVELRDRSLRTERDIKAYLGLPTLVMLPSIAAEEKKIWARWPKWGKERGVSVPSA